MSYRSLKNILHVAAVWSLLMLTLLSCATTDEMATGNKDSQNYALLDSGMSDEEIIREAATVTPSQRQYEWQKLEYTAFIHFGMNTFTNREWGDGSEDPELFNPSDFDADQWMQVLKDAGIKMVILTAKHHDGFCLWPSQYTEHDVENSPWKDGKGDVVGEVAEAADRAGLKFGVYLSPWDRHEPSYGNSDEYNDYFVNQLTELLTQYGEIDEVWFDGAKGDDVDQTYDWVRYYRTIRDLQPNAVIAVRGPDVRWVGTETGYGRETEWSVLPGGPVDNNEHLERGLIKPQVNAQDEDLGSRDKLKGAESLFWYPSEVDVSIRPGWFYHEEEDSQVKSLNKMLDIYYSSVGRNSLLLLNIPPDTRGQIHEEDASRLRELREELDKTFDENIAANGEAVSDNGSAGNLTDGDIETHWSPADKATKGSATLHFKQEQEINRLMLQENILEGQRVERFTVEAQVKGDWQQIAEGTTIGYKRLLRFPSLNTSKVRLNIERARMTPAIAELGLYKAPERLTNPEIRRNKQGEVQIITESEDTEIFYTLDGSTPTPESRRYEEPFDLASGGTVKARGYIQDQEQAGEVIEQTFDIAKKKWRVLSTDDHVDGFEGEKAIDSNPETMWHTDWQDDSQSHPHEIIIDLGETVTLEGFTYLPRQGENISGTINDYRVYVSDDPKNWSEPVKSGEFENIRNNPIQQSVHFDRQVTGRYIKVEALNSVFEEETWTSVAEIGVITTQ